MKKGVELPKNLMLMILFVVALAIIILLLIYFSKGIGESEVYKSVTDWSNRFKLW